jgi:hypothetical protein
MNGTLIGLNRWEYEAHRKGDCKLHNADGAERNRNDGSGFQSTVFDNDRMFDSCCKRRMSPHKGWNPQLRRCRRNIRANASIHTIAKGEKTCEETTSTLES